MNRFRTLLIGAATILAVLLIVAIVAGAADILSSWWGAIALVSALGAVLLALNYVKGWIPARTILEFDLAQGLVEQVPSDPLGRLSAAKAYPLRDLMDALERAATDKRVVGLLARIDYKSLGVARAQELADAISAFGEAGKPTVAYAETIGETGAAGLPEMLVASACDEFYLQPNADLGLHGLDAKGPYLGGMFAKLGVIPSFDHRHEYKAAKYRLTDTSMPPPAREASEAVFGDQYEQLLNGISQSRGISRETLQAVVDNSPSLAAEALDAGIVDDLMYRDEVFAKVESAWGTDKHLDVGKYLKRVGRPHKRGDTIALVYGTGAVTRGHSRFEPLTRAPSMGSDDVTAAFRKAIDNKKVKAIVFRIDSPGGSAVASESMMRETVRAIEQGKPVIASMGDLAGSGGYYIAARCSRIVAQPGTITGSIGVVFGKLVTSGMWAKAGINFDGVQLGDMAGFSSSQEDYSEAGRSRMNAILDDVYQAFTALVAEGRGMTTEQVHGIAKGRIWSGQAALANGLIDEVGGMHRALELAAEAAGIEDHKFRVAVYPPKKKPLAQLLRKEDKGLEIARQVLEMTEPLSAMAAEIEAANPTALRMPGFAAKL
jgi:protease-4